MLTLPLAILMLFTPAGCSSGAEAPAKLRLSTPGKALVASEDLHEVEWLEARQAAQLASTDRFDVFYGFGFSDEQPASGIDFRHRVVPDAAKDYKAVHYDHGNGVLAGDVDGDGAYDLYFSSQVGGNQLWRNLGDGRFENITGDSPIAMRDTVNVSGAFGDIDNDGDPDLYVTTVRQGNRMFENDGRGNFSDITEAAGLTLTAHSSGVVFFDYDRDGQLDLFVSNVGRYTTDEQESVSYGAGTLLCFVGLDDAFDGHLYADRPEASVLYRGLGGNRFEDVSEQAGLVDKSWTGDASAFDGNRDGWPDLYLLNMQGHDHYYENDQQGHFIDRSREVFPKTPWGTMGIKAFDYDNDGDDDLYLTDMHSDMSQNITPALEKYKSDMQIPESTLQSEGLSIFGNAFFAADGEGGFDEISDEIKAENYWPWGLSVGDLNADGYDDVFITSSMNFPFRYGVNSLLLNNRGETFLDSEFLLGVEPRRDGLNAVPWFTEDCAELDATRGTIPLVEEACRKTDRIEVWGYMGSRASVIFDLDADGDLDIVTNEFGSVPLVLRSDLAEARSIHYLEVALVGKASNRDGLGARVTVTTADGRYTKVHDGASGYLSHSLLPLYFGLDEAEQVEEIEVLWPSGQRQVITDGIGINGSLRIEEAAY